MTKGIGHMASQILGAPPRHVLPGWWFTVWRWQHNLHCNCLKTSLSAYFDALARDKAAE